MTRCFVKHNMISLSYCLCFFLLWSSKFMFYIIFAFIFFFSSIFITRLQPQQGPPHSPNPRRPATSTRPKSLKQLFQQVIKPAAPTCLLRVISNIPCAPVHILLLLLHFTFPCVLYFFLPKAAILHFIFFLLFLLPPFSSLTLIFFFFFVLVFLRLSSFYTVASEEYGHRRLER